MSRFVLVHGAWHGAWCWRDVAERLRAEGHEVLTPTLKGVGERIEELSPDVRLQDHVADIVTAVGDERSVLVGHSYAGLVVREAADRAPENVARVVLVDGWAGGAGASMFSLAPEWFVDGLRGLAVKNGDGWFLPAPDPVLVGVTDAAQVRWLEANLTAHPLRTFEDATELSGAVDGIPGTAIVCRPGAGLPFEALANSIGYRVVDLDSGHDAMVLAPESLAMLLLQAAASS